MNCEDWNVSPSSFLAHSPVYTSAAFAATKLCCERIGTSLPGANQGYEAGELVFAARAKHVQDHQFRIGKKPLLGFGSRCSCGTDQRAEVS